MAVKVITESEFEAEVLKSDVPVLVDFYADWCGPCRQLAPVLEEVDKAWGSKLKVLKVDTEASPQLAGAFQIRSLPTMMVIKDKKMIDRISGFMDRSRLFAHLSQVVGPPPAQKDDEAEEMETRRAVLAVEAGLVIPVDIREESDWKRTRLPGALNLPPEQHDKLADNLPEGTRKLLIYARTDDGAKEVADKIAGLGRRVAFLSGGLIDWELASAPVDRG